MLKRIAIVAMLAFAPLSIGACANTGTTTPPTATQVTQAQQNLHTAELAYNGALKAIQVLVRNGVLKGTKAEAVRKAVLAAKAAIDVARVGVDAGGADLSLILVAATKVVELLALYKL